MIDPVYLPDHPGCGHPLLHPRVGELEADAVQLGVISVGVQEELLPVSQGHLRVQLSCRVHHLKHSFQKCFHQKVAWKKKKVNLNYSLSTDKASNIRYVKGRVRYLEILNVK